MHLWLRAATCASIWTRITFAACDTESTTTLANSNVITALTSCATFSGSVALATDISGHIALDGVQEITGDVYISNASELVSLTGDSLSTIGGDLTLDGVQKLSTLDFPRLTSVGNVTWSSLPNLQSVGLDQGLSADEVDIQNTQLQQLNITKAAKITIVNNPFAANISIAVNNVTNDLVISANNPAMTVDLPNLYWANNITLTNVSDVSMPLLNTIGNNFNIYGSTIGVLKIPNLNVVWGGLSLISNYQLTSIQIPSLVQVGTLVISNNSELRKFTLDELGIVSYAITVDGHLSNVSLPSITSVGGSFQMSSTNTSFNCDDFDYYETNGYIDGQYSCNGTHTNSSFTSTSSGDSGASSPAPSGGLSTGAKAGIGVGVSIGVIALLLLGVYVWRLKSKHKRIGNKELTEDEDKQNDIMGELHGDSVGLTELGNGKEAQELPGPHGVSEAEGGRKIHEIRGTHELPP